MSKILSLLALVLVNIFSYAQSIPGQSVSKTRPVTGSETRSAPDTLFRFAHVTDIHVGASTGLEDLKATVSDINTLDNIEFVILSGDITEMGTDEEFLAAKSELDKLNKPWYIVPGNHDSKWSESGTNSFKQIFGAESFSFIHKGFLFLGNGSGPNMRMSPGQVQREDLYMMDSVLKMHDKSVPIIYINHYPLDKGLNNWYEVLDRMKGRNLKASFCGHGHNNRKMNFVGIPGIMGRSNLRAKKEVGGFNIISITHDSLYVNTRLTGRRTLPYWHAVNIHPDSMPQWDPNPVRPDFSMNNQYSNVKTNWTVQEPADIGAGIGKYKNAIIYSNSFGDIKAVDVATGKELWIHKTEGKIYATPLVVKGKLIIPSTSGNIYCLDAATGARKWEFKGERPFVGSAAAYKNLVIVSGSDGKCRAVDLNSGKEKWVFNEVKGFVETRPLIDKRSVYFGSWGNEFYSLDAKTGRLNWKWSSPSRNRLLSPAVCFPVASSKMVFTVAPDRHMTAYNKRSGEVVWRNFDSAHWVRESIGISDNKKVVYVKTMQGRVLAIDAESSDRKILWTSKLDMDYEISPSPIVEHNDLVFVPTESGVIFVLNKNNGEIKWKHKISNCLVNAVYPADDHTIIATTMDGMVRSISY